MRYFYLIFLVALLGCNHTPIIIVASSANMQYPMQEIIEKYELKCDCKIDLIVGSSGKLTAQIEQGAPYDIFVSANSMYPNYLYNKGLTKESPKIYAYGQLILLSSNDKVITLNDLNKSYVKKIAIANGDIAPYGKASVQLLKKLNIYNAILPKLVFGESVSQVNQFIESGTVDVGFTAMSSVKSNHFKPNKGWVKIDNKLYDPIIQSAVIIKRKSQNELVNRFHEDLFTPKVQLILKKYGYLIPNE
jgi:molybdate transport system substrate-binding protein